MKKLVPDPPQANRPTTSPMPFGSCETTHPHLFEVRGGIELECALIHLSRVLEAAQDSNLQACNLADKRAHSLNWATQQSLEMGMALVQSLLKH